jgi:hypothetical protein
MNSGPWGNFARGDGAAMKQETIEYFRRREQAEREAVLTASCEEARWAHQQMAAAYARLLEVEVLEASGALPAGKVISLCDSLRAREHAEFGRRRAILRNAPEPSARRA